MAPNLVDSRLANTNAFISQSTVFDYDRIFLLQIISDKCATSGEELKVYHEEFGWCWCKNNNGIKGWIPTKNLRFKI